MTRREALLFVSITLAAVTSTACNPGTVSMTCTPGRQVACACSGGRQGYQLCRDDGTAYGACTGCDDAGVSHTDSAVDVPTTIDVTSADTGPAMVDTGPTITDTGPPDVVEPVDTFVPPADTGPTFAWVWIDRGGPAFQPHACRAGPGVVDGMLVDPMAFFSSLVAGRDPNMWQQAMNDIETELWSCGVGQQRGSGGDVRGRLFLPTAGCPDASPPAGDTTAMHLGVRQEPDCWSHPADVVSEL
jgi:hypothetical protein